MCISAICKTWEIIAEMWQMLLDLHKWQNIAVQSRDVH